MRRLLLKVSQPDTRFLTDDDRALIHDRLRDDMRHLHDTHGVDVNQWGFEV
jgi:hypothetical protein